MINFCTLKSAGHPGNYGAQLVAWNSVTCVSPVSLGFIIPWGVFGSSVMHGQRLSEYIFSVFFYGFEISISNLMFFSTQTRKTPVLALRSCCFLVTGEIICFGSLRTCELALRLPDSMVPFSVPLQFNKIWDGEPNPNNGVNGMERRASSCFCTRQDISLYFFAVFSIAVNKQEEG